MAPRLSPAFARVPAGSEAALQTPVACHNHAPRSSRQRRARPGESLTLTTYWQPLAPPAGQYTFFAQVLADFGGSNTRWAAFDNTPPEGTMSWSTDEVYRVELPLQLAEGAPAGILPIIIGAYTRTDEGGFANLQLVSADGRLSNENLWSLTQIRIDE